tara:strand:+ start:214 stop:1011 length:798 start_codon:yes stop_codon:yes gene_type:complete
MSIKTFIQFLILILIISIIGGVYYNYFKTNEDLVEEVNSSDTLDQLKLEELEKKISDLEEKNTELEKEISQTKKETKEIVTQNTLKEKNQKNNDIVNLKVENKKVANELIKDNKKENENIKVKNLVKDVEYTSIDQKGNKFHLLANSGKSNTNNSDILDLNNVRGKITSDKRDTIYIVSDFAQYNSVNLNSKFYKNVIINYQDKEITCINFDINMETNKAIAYENVLITDPKSTMKAGIVEFDLKTKDINIRPESSTEEIEVITN